jgi:hypothetical protein
MAVQHDAGSATWPGLQVRPGGLEMDPEALIAAAARLEAIGASVGDESAGAVSPLHQATAQPAGTSFFGGWDVAREVAEGYRVAQEAIVECYLRLVHETHNAAALLRENAGETARVDRHGAAAMDRQHAVVDESGQAGRVREA